MGINRCLRVRTRIEKEAWDFRLGPDGMVWTFVGDAMVRIDPSDGAIRPVGKLGPGRIAFSGGNVYLGGTTAVRRVEGLAVPTAGE